MREDKSRSAFVIFVNPDITSHILNRQFTDSQSQPCSLYKFIQLLEALEYKFLLVFGDSCTSVGHRK